MSDSYLISLLVWADPIRACAWSNGHLATLTRTGIGMRTLQAGQRASQQETNVEAHIAGSFAGFMWMPDFAMPCVAACSSDGWALAWLSDLG